jgi:hypothetical protein
VSNYSFLKLGKRSEVKLVKFQRAVSEIAFATLGESSIHLYHFDNMTIALAISASALL